MERDQAVYSNNNIIPNDNSTSDSSLNSQDFNGSNFDDGSDGHLNE